MNISICTTVFNEEKTISGLLDSLLAQTQKPDEIVIVDGGSSDKTVEIIRHYQKKDSRIKLMVEKCSRAKGRNLAVEMAKNNIVAMTDAGCVAQPDWLKNLVGPFETGRVDVSAGFYKMVSKNSFEKAELIFLGTKPSDFNINFLPSTRSIAFTKEIWEKVGGFPENLTGAAEDTVFNFKIVKNEAKIARVKNAIVEWGMPETIYNFQFTIFNYAKGDAKSHIWFFPGKGLTSHNIKALFVILRYILGFLFLIYCVYHPPLFIYFFICLFAYLAWSYRKAGFWGIPLQLTADFAVISGFISGIIGR